MATAQQEPLYRIRYASGVTTGTLRTWAQTLDTVRSLHKPRAGWGLRVERV